jgi:signal peptidase I
MAGLFEWWRERSTWRRARVEGRHLVKEARRILRRKDSRVTPSAAQLVGGAADAVDEALAGTDFEAARKAITALDDAMDHNLAFARKSTLREYSESIGIAVAIALLLRAFVVEAFQIPSGSMIPTLEVGDHIFVSKFSYGLGVPFSNIKLFELHHPDRGDVIVFKYPLEPGTDYIKRVVGLPGDVIEVRRNQVIINGHPMPRQRVDKPCKYVDAQQRPGGYVEEHDCEGWVETLGDRKHATIQEPGRGTRDYGPFTVPAGNVFVMGDNRDNSSDSRVWGTVQYDLIKGKALIVWWSRAPTEGWDPGLWFRSIRWNRFFQVVR